MDPLTHYFNPITNSLLPADIYCRLGDEYQKYWFRQSVIINFVDLIIRDSEPRITINEVPELDVRAWNYLFDKTNNKLYYYHHVQNGQTGGYIGYQWRIVDENLKVEQCRFIQALCKLHK